MIIIHDFNLNLQHFRIPEDFFLEIKNQGFSLIDKNDASANDLEDAKIFFGNRIRTSDLETMPNLKYIHLGCMGYDNLDLTVLKEKGVLLTNSKGIVEKSISEMVLLSILYFNHCIDRTEIEIISSGRNNLDKHYNSFKTTDSLKVIVFGTGSIGIEIIKTLKRMNIECTGVNRSGKNYLKDTSVLKLDKALSQIGSFDIVVNALPLNPSTRNMFDYETLSLFKSDTVYINIGRKETTNSKELIEVLKYGRLRGVYLDVYEDEFLQGLSSLTPERMRSVLLTPHNSGWASSYWQKQRKLVMKNLLNFHNGKFNELINIV